MNTLRHRDLGIELMIEDPSDFVLSFEGPSEDDLCSKLAKLLVSNEKQARESARRAASRSEVKDPVEYTEQLMKNPLEHALEATAPDPVDAGEESEVANILELSCPQGQIFCSISARRGGCLRSYPGSIVQAAPLVGAASIGASLS